jgi:hypothetical protein
MTYLPSQRAGCLHGQFHSVYQEFVMRIAFNLAAAFVSSAVIMLAVI